MSSQVTVIGPGARRHIIKVTPGRYLTEIRDEACEKFRLDPAQHGLKYVQLVSKATSALDDADLGPHRNNNKQLDLTRVYRLAGLPSGAKLELTQVSRSPSVVSVALQLPELEAKGLPSSRLTEKFSSATSLWQILRAFESGKVGGTGVVKNFTCRGVPHTASGNSGAGRLWQEMPVVHIMGRDYATFTDLQKTLSQLGFNDGTVLLRLGFRTTDTPLEEAMQLIEQYFKSMEENTPPGAHAGSAAQSESVPAQSQPESLDDIQSPKPPEPDAGEQSETLTTSETQTEKSTSPSLSAMTPTSTAVSIPSVTSRPITVFAAPSSTTPRAALQQHNPTDYEPSVDMMKSHQAHIAASTRNKRLPTDAEIAEQEATQARKLASVQKVHIKIILPDQMSVQTAFTAADTAEDLYAHVRDLLARPEPFTLSFNATKGMTPMKEGKEKLIGDLKLTGGVVVRVVWAQGASLDARRGPSLRKEVAEQAQQIQVKEIAESAEQGNGTEGRALGQKEEEKKEKGKGGVPKWLKLPGKK